VGYLDVFIVDENGAGWKSISDLTAKERDELAVDVMLAEMNLQPAQLLCFTCLAPIPDGTGSSFCDTHK
jgi:hypothetical protein